MILRRLRFFCGVLLVFFTLGSEAQSLRWVAPLTNDSEIESLLQRIVNRRDFRDSENTFWIVFQSAAPSAESEVIVSLRLPQKERGYYATKIKHANFASLRMRGDHLFVDVQCPCREVDQSQRVLTYELFYAVEAGETGQTRLYIQKTAHRYERCLPHS